MSDYKDGVKWDQEKLSRLVILWQTARTADEAVERIGGMYSEVMGQVTRLRAHGVPLKRFRKRPMDYLKLSDLARKHALDKP